MLITLQSTNDTDANDFSNHFKETVDILPNSEVALVSMSYNFQNSITVSAGVNDQFSLRVGHDQIVPITIPFGSYTPAAFEAAFQQELDQYVSGLPYEYQKSFGDITVNNDGESEKLVLTIKYDPKDWDSLKCLSTGAADRQKVKFSGTTGGLIQNPSAGILSSTDPVGGLNRQIWVAGSGAEDGYLWGHADDNTHATPHGSYKFQLQDTQRRIYVCLAETTVPADLATTPVQIRLGNTGTFDIYEANALGALQSILTGAQSYAGFKTFEIRVDAEPTVGSTVVRYFYDGTELTKDNGKISPSADRWEYREDSKLIPCGSFFDDYISNFVPEDGATDYKLDDVIESINFTTAGSGYLVGELVEIKQFTSDSYAYVETVDGNGGITSVVFSEHGGDFVSGNNTTSIVGLASGANDALAVINSVIDSVEISTAGTGYAAAPAIFVDIESGVTGVITGAIRIDGVDGAGGITDFEWIDDLSQTELGVAYPIDFTVLSGNNDAVIRLNAVNSTRPSLANVEFTTVLSDVDEPLMQQNTAAFIPTAGFQALTHLPLASGDASDAAGLQSVATKAPSDSREAEQMLVNIDQFQIKSICKRGGIQKAVAAVPYGERENPTGNDPQSGYFFYEAYNLLYHDLSNSHTENHNQLRVRMTDAVGNPLSQLVHPTTVTLDLRPRAR